MEDKDFQGRVYEPRLGLRRTQIQENHARWRVPAGIDC